MPLERFDWTMRIGSVQEHLTRYAWALKWCVRKRVLDAGCGIGYGSWLIFNVANSVTGIDRSHEGIMQARGLGICTSARWHINFHKVRLEDFCPPDAFDTVVCFEVLEHLEDMEAGLAKLLSMVVPGGTLLLSLPVLNGENPYHRGRDYTLAQWDEFIGKFIEGRGFDLLRFFQPCVEDGAEVSNCCIVARSEDGEAIPEDASGSALYVVRVAL